MLMIRLQRLGKSKHPSYRLIVSEKQRDPQARHVEVLGHYVPTSQPKTIELKEDRIKYWMSVGAQPSATVHNLLMSRGIIPAQKKKKSVYVSKSRRAALEKKKANPATA